MNMDIRTVRKQFFDRKLKYACSLDQRLRFDLARATLAPEGVKVNALGEPAARLGHVFHVLDQTSVEGVDGRQHDCPVGALDYAEASVLFHRGTSYAETAGRMTFKTDDETTIELTYGGTLQFRAWPEAILHYGHAGAPPREHPRALEAAAFLVPVFSTTNTRYRWLSEHGCVAFGKWIASPGADGAGPRIVEARVDVYAAG